MDDIAEVKRTVGVESLPMPVSFRFPDEVAAFLRANPAAVDLARSAIERLPNYFPEATAEIDVEIDPDGAADDTLFVTARTDLEAKEAMAALDRFDREYWIPTLTAMKAMQPAGVPMVVTVAMRRRHPAA